MGLDQYAYVAARAGQRDEYYDSYDLESETSDKTPEPREIAYWRKHPNLQGWMERLWAVRNPEAVNQTSFNGVELELTWEDLEALERDVTEGNLPATRGFFFGDDSDEYYCEQDLAFVKTAKAELFLGLKVFYNSSW
jgi:hypothetical protein